MFSHIITSGSSLPEARGGHSLCAIICERVLTIYLPVPSRLQTKRHFYVRIPAEGQIRFVEINKKELRVHEVQAKWRFCFLSNICIY
jgi:hypothetical protein